LPVLVDEIIGVKMGKKLVILTGGAGFIGSCFLWKLNSSGISNILVVDELDGEDKQKNLEGKKFVDYVHKDDFLNLVNEDKAPYPEHVVHMGACSSTTCTDKAYLIKNNYEYSKLLTTWTLKHQAPFLYASSGATYGDGKNGYNDDHAGIRKLQPLNMYGCSKQLFDLWVLDNMLENKVTGLKFFNVFGPNEYHKGEMRSVVCKKFEEVAQKGVIRLFKSYNDEFKDGEQKRDFIYVKDAVEVMYYFFCNPDKTGIFNLGAGVAHSWNELALAMFKALKKEPKIEYIEMPENLISQYQYFTQANMEKLRNAGCNFKFSSLEDAVADYIAYLQDKKYL